MIATLLLAASAILPADSFVKGENGVWSCDLSGIGISVTPGEYHSGGWTNVPRHPSLYFGSAPMTLAREPEEGSWFTFEGEDNVTVTGLPDSGYSLAGYWTHDWAFEILRVASVSNGVARFKDKHVFGIGKTSWGQKKRRFYAEEAPVLRRRPQELPRHRGRMACRGKHAFLYPARGRYRVQSGDDRLGRRAGLASRTPARRGRAREDDRVWRRRGTRAPRLPRRSRGGLHD